MRRLRSRPIHILVHPDFHKILDYNRQVFSKKVGVDITNTRYTEILARSKINLNPNIGGHFDIKKKRRRF